MDLSRSAAFAADDLTKKRGPVGDCGWRAWNESRLLSGHSCGNDLPLAQHEMYNIARQNRGTVSGVKLAMVVEHRCQQCSREFGSDFEK